MLLFGLECGRSVLLRQSELRSKLGVFLGVKPLNVLFLSTHVLLRTIVLSGVLYGCETW